MYILNENVTINHCSTANETAIENAVAKSTATIASMEIGDLAEAFGLRSDSFADLTWATSLLPELHLAKVLRLPETQDIPVLGHYETSGIEIFPLYYLYDVECSECRKIYALYFCITATPEGCVFSECAVHGLTTVDAGIRTIADVKNYLETYYNLSDIPSLD